MFYLEVYYSNVYNTTCIKIISLNMYNIINELKKVRYWKIV